MDIQIKYKMVEKKIYILLCCMYENILTGEELNTIIGEYKQIFSDNLDEAADALASFNAHVTNLKYEFWDKLQERIGEKEQVAAPTVDDCCNKKTNISTVGNKEGI